MRYFLCEDHYYKSRHIIIGDYRLGDNGVPLCQYSLEQMRARMIRSTIYQERTIAAFTDNEEVAKSWVGEEIWNDWLNDEVTQRAIVRKPKVCTCGAKHTSSPNIHTNWCDGK
jgi:hypothetical protein